MIWVANMSSVKLADIELVKVIKEEDIGRIKEARSTTEIKVMGSRKIIAHEIPGMEGGVVQDLGRGLRGIELEGFLSGPDAKNLVQTLWEKFYAGEPVSFKSDIAGAADIDQVIIEDFKVERVEGRPDTYSYLLKLREYIPPPEPEEEEPEPQDEEAREETEEEVEKARDGYNRLVGRVVDEDGNPIPNVKVIARGKGAEYNAVTDKNGEYVIENLEPGEYEVFVEGYEEEKRIVRIPPEEVEETGVEIPGAPLKEKPEEITKEKEELEKERKRRLKKQRRELKLKKKNLKRK